MRVSLLFSGPVLGTWPNFCGLDLGPLSLFIFSYTRVGEIAWMRKFSEEQDQDQFTSLVTTAWIRIIARLIQCDGRLVLRANSGPIALLTDEIILMDSIDGLTVKGMQSAKTARIRI